MYLWHNTLGLNNLVALVAIGWLNENQFDNHRDLGSTKLFLVSI